MTSYRDLLVDVLGDVPLTVDSPAIARARSAIDEQLRDRTGLGADRYYRDLFADVVGDVWPTLHSAAAEAAYAALIREPLCSIDEHQRRYAPAGGLAGSKGGGIDEAGVLV